MNIAIDAHDITLIGGIERFVAQFANAMTRRGHHIFLFTYAAAGAIAHFPLEPSTSIIHYDFSGDRIRIPTLRQQLLACRADLCLSPASYNNHLLWCAALEGTGIPWIYSEHSNPWIIEQERWSRAERQATLCAADAVHVLLESFRESVPRVAQERVHVIPNPLDIPIAGEPAPESSRKTLLSLGRLAENKQNSLLVRAFASLSPAFPAWHLDIWGTGAEEKALQREITALGMTEKIRLCGATSTPRDRYLGADIFCMSSR
ncbi:MAG: glycosyltransferase, partial [Desulfovibrionaceae bacterium]|nr:glycosyltransferase [Desulfovibrionaceae bacterium]